MGTGVPGTGGLLRARAEGRGCWRAQDGAVGAPEHTPHAHAARFSGRPITAAAILYYPLHPPASTRNTAYSYAHTLSLHSNMLLRLCTAATSTSGHRHLPPHMAHVLRRPASHVVFSQHAAFFLARHLQRAPSAAFAVTSTREHTPQHALSPPRHGLLGFHTCFAHPASGCQPQTFKDHVRDDRSHQFSNGLARQVRQAEGRRTPSTPSTPRLAVAPPLPALPRPTRHFQQGHIPEGFLERRAPQTLRRDDIFVVVHHLHTGDYGLAVAVRGTICRTQGKRNTNRGWVGR